MSTILSYKVKCSMSLVTSAGTEYKLNPAYIKSIVTEYKFKENIMPIIYAILDVDKELYRRILDNATDGNFLISIYNYNANSDYSLQKEILQDQFIYFVPTKYNYSKDIEGEGDQVAINMSEDPDHIVLGFIKTTMIYNNKFSFNGVFENTTSEEMLARFMEGLPDVFMDELQNNAEYESLLLPPQSTRSNAIDYLFKKDQFYDTDYVFFMDFKKTYLLNTSGDARNTNKATVMFRIEDISSRSAYYTGISKDNEDGAYVIYVNMSDVNVSINTTTDKSYNQTVSSYTDQVTTVDSNITMYSKETTNMQDFTKANVMGAEIRKQAMDNTAVVINLTKMNMDSTLITPDKQFIISYDKYSSYNGKYILIYKKEVIVKTGDSYDTTTMIGLQRLAEQDSSLLSSKASSLRSMEKSATRSAVTKSTRNVTKTIK